MAEKSPATHTLGMYVFAEWLSTRKLNESSMTEMVPLPDLIRAQDDSTPRLLRYIIHGASWRNDARMAAWTHSMATAGTGL